jgi:signal transduction histidine kinase
MFNRLQLRDKMTLWYTLLALFTVLTFSCIVYFILQYVLEDILESNTRLLLQQVTAQVEEENGSVIFENEVPIASNAMYFITEENGSELASYGADITLFDNIPVEPGMFQHVRGAAEEWLILDSNVVSANHFSQRVRVATSCELNNRVLSTLRLVFISGIPLILLAAVLGGRLIAKRSLTPIRQIIHSANQISEGDLSARIPQTSVKDELGELAITLNGMLQNVETAFIREKRFASDASHELRTPVAVLYAYTESLLIDELSTDGQKTSLTTMLNECIRMQKIIDQLLLITRGQEKRYPICMEEINFWKICCGVSETLADKLNDMNISIHINVPNDLTFQGDQSLLTELMLNLVENAVKYGKVQGQITIDAEKSGNNICIGVRDDGIGISEDALPHIFERFYRVDAARNRNGTGLGLSIAYWIVNAHRGTIKAESVLGKGTVFTISLPMVQGYLHANAKTVPKGII